ncbi:hypothetical protein AA0112_g629 [Alternaria arborescens]|nr:hypothetical protein AA0112_g629 [Alternaria arborescens]
MDGFCVAPERFLRAKCALAVRVRTNSWRDIELSKMLSHMGMQVESAVKLQKAIVQRRIDVAQAQEAMPGDYNYAIELDQSTKNAKFREVEQTKML